MIRTYAATITTPGIYPEITPAQYFAEPCPAPALTNSMISKLLKETPRDAAFHHVMLNPDGVDPSDSAAKRMGDVTHQLALGKGRGYAIFDGPTFAHKGGKEFKEAAKEDGLTPICAPKFAECEAMADVLRMRISAELDAIAKARGLPSQPAYETEVVFAWKEGDVWCRGMLDVWCPDLAVALDPKITSRLIDARIRPHMENMGWDQQGVWYERGLNQILPDMAGRVTFADLMVNPNPPHTYRAVRVSAAWAAGIQPQLDRAVALWGSCLATNEWPGYADGIETLDPTPWKLKAFIEAEFEAEMDDENA